MQVRTLSLGLSILFAGACNKAADPGDTGGTPDFGDMDDIEENEDEDEDEDEEDDEDEDDGGSSTGGDTSGGSSTGGSSTGGSSTGGDTSGGSSTGGSSTGGDTSGGTSGGSTSGGSTSGGSTSGGSMGGGSSTGGSSTGGTSGGSTSGGSSTGGTSGGETSGGTSGGETSGGGSEGGATTGGGGSGADVEEPDAGPIVSEGAPDSDEDGDGYTEDDGDCDDTDRDISPDGEEDCDGIDTNCDGYLDLEYWDGFEPNDDFDMAYDLGEIDGWFFGTTTVAMTELNFDYAADEDWFVWDANDTFYDDPTITINVDTYELMNLNVELYVYREDSDSFELLVDQEIRGETGLTITEDDFPTEESTGWWDSITDWASGLFDGSYDYFYLKISTTPTTWDEDLCRTGIYDLTIGS